MSSSVLVTGGAGFVGSHACKALAQAGYRPVVYDDLRCGSADAVRWGPLELGDLGNRDALRTALREHRIETVMHFAAFASVGESMIDPRSYFANNVANTLTLLDVMLDAGVGTIVFSSSCATYGTPTSVPISEDHPQEPVNPYGESKLMVERIIDWYGRAYGLQSATLRYFNAAGADPDGEIGENHDPETHLVPLAIQTALGRWRVLPILGADYPTPDGTAVRDYVHVSDLAGAHVCAMEHLRAGGENRVFNLGTGRGHSVRQVVSEIERISGERLPVKLEPRRAGDPAVLVADATRVKSELGWDPALSDLRTIVETAWEWQARKSEPRRAISA